MRNKVNITTFIRQLNKMSTNKDPTGLPQQLNIDIRISIILCILPLVKALLCLFIIKYASFAVLFMLRIRPCQFTDLQ